MRAHLLKHGAKIVRVGRDSDIGMVLRRRADHRRPADIDVLDAIVIRRAARDRLFERIEIHIEKIDGEDVVRRHRGDMVGRVAHRQEPAMNGGMERLDAPIHHFRKARRLAHITHRQAGSRQRGFCAAGGDERHAQFMQRARVVDEAILIGE